MQVAGKCQSAIAPPRHFTTTGAVPGREWGRFHRRSKREGRVWGPGRFPWLARGWFEATGETGRPHLTGLHAVSTVRGAVPGSDARLTLESGTRLRRPGPHTRPPERLPTGKRRSARGVGGGRSVGYRRGVAGVRKEGDGWAAPLGLAALLYALLIPFVLRPWFLGSDLLPQSDLSLGMMEDTDLDLNIWILAWVAHALVSDPAALFAGNIFYPSTNAIAGSENMLAHVPVTVPAWLLTGDALVVFKAMVFESFLLSGLAMWGWVYFHTRSAVAALLAGAAFTFAPWRVQNLPHPQYLGFAFFPLALLGVDLWLACRRRRALVLVASGMAMQALACLYLGLFSFLSVPVYVLVRLRGAERPLGAAVGLLLAGIAGALLALPVALPYLEASRSGMIESFSVARFGDWSFKPWWYLGAPFLHRAGAPLLVVVGLDLLVRAGARFRGRRLPRSPVETALWVMLLWAVWLSAGPEPTLPGGMPLPTPYGLLQAVVPGFAELRGPRRLFMMVALALSALAGFAVWRLGSIVSARVRLVAAVVGLGAFALAAAPQPARVASAGKAEAEALAQVLGPPPGEGALLELPGAATERDILGDRRNARYMLASTRHGWPLLGGMTGHNPPLGAFYDSIARRLPDAAALDALARVVDVQRIALHRDRFLEGRPFESGGWAEGVPAGLHAEGEAKGTVFYSLAERPPADWRARLEEQISGETRETFDGVSKAPLAAACRSAAILSVAAPRVVAIAPVPIVVPVVFRNESDCPWPGFSVLPEGLVGLTYFWRDPSGREVRFPPPAFSPLIADVPPHTEVASSVVVQPVSGPEGAWELVVELVQWGDAEPLASFSVPVEARAFRAATAR